MNWDDLMIFRCVRQPENESAFRVRENRYYNEVNKVLTASALRKMEQKSVLYPADGNVRSMHNYVAELIGCVRNICENIFISRTDEGADNVADYMTGYFAGDLSTVAAVLSCSGRPPFGYPGELAMRKWFNENPLVFSELFRSPADEQMQKDLLCYSGNGMSVRRTVRYCEKGINITYPVIKIISGLHEGEGVGSFYSEREYVRAADRITGAGEAKHPLSFVLSAAKKISFITALIEDAAIHDHVMCRQILCLLRNENCLDDRTDDDEYEQLACVTNMLSDGYKQLRADPFESDDCQTISAWLGNVRRMLCRAAAGSFRDNYSSIMEGTFTGRLLDCSPLRTVVNSLDMLYEHLILRSVSVTAVMMKTEVMIKRLMDLFVRPAYESFSMSDDEFLNSASSALIPKLYRRVYSETSEGKSRNEKMYMRILMTADFICSLTDRQAEEMVRKFTA